MNRGRYLVVGVVALAAFWMYIDRVCFSTLSKQMGVDLGVNSDSMSFALGAFFLAYGLCQLPAGLLADRFGPRLVLALCVLGWSTAVAATAFVGGFTGLLVVRLALGVAEAGAYPAATALVRNWATPQQRGLFSSIITAGGRVGGALGPYLTGLIAVAFVKSEASEGNWQAVFLIYGVAGVAVAAVLWAIVRDRPPSIGVLPVAARSSGPPMRLLLARLAASRNLWLFGAAQFGTNFGWAFLVTKMPDYLIEVHCVPLEKRGLMQTAPLAVGCVGMLLGGLLTDRLAARYGRRWGRALPIGGSLMGCAVAYGVCSSLSNVWAVVAALCMVAVLVDLQVPAIWAFSQDVGGRHAGAAAGWGNMWGNLGSAASPVILGWLAARHGWPAAFAACSVGFVAAGLAGFLLDASRPLDDGSGATNN